MKCESAETPLCFTSLSLSTSHFNYFLYIIKKVRYFRPFAHKNRVRVKSEGAETPLCFTSLSHLVPILRGSFSHLSKNYILRFPLCDFFQILKKVRYFRPLALHSHSQPHTSITSCISLKKLDISDFSPTSPKRPRKQGIFYFLMSLLFLHLSNLMILYRRLKRDNLWIYP